MARERGWISGLWGPADVGVEGLSGDATLSSFGLFLFFFLILQMCVVYTMQNGGLGFIIHMAKKSGVTNFPPSGL